MGDLRMTKQKMSNQFEFSPCPLCNSFEFALRYTARDLIAQTPGVYSVVRCTACGLSRTQPRPLESCISNFYPTNYGPYAKTKLVDDEKKYRSKSSTWILVLKGVLKAMSRSLGINPQNTLPIVETGPVKLLDYGCASGGYLNSLDRVKYQPIGVDFSVDALNDAKKLGLTVFCEPVAFSHFEPGSFDIITAWMVLEHLYDPIGTLRKLRHWLAEDGFIMISVPDASALHRKIFRGLSYDDQVPTHLIHYDVRTIKGVMNKAGFSVVEVRWQPNSRSLLLSVRNVLDACHLGRVSKTYVNIIDSRLGRLAAYFLGFFLALIRQSARIEIIAKKS